MRPFVPAEDKIFEANEAADRAEADAIQADLDAERFEKKLKRALAELKEVRAQLERAQQQHKPSEPVSVEIVFCSSPAAC